METGRRALAACLVLAAAAHGADVTVTSQANSGAGSLRQALADVPAGGTIVFSAAVFTETSRTIALTTELVTGKHVTIDAGNLSDGLVVSGGNASRIFRVAAGGNLTIKRVALTGGNGAGTVTGGFGGAVINDGALRLEECTLSGNQATFYGGAISSAGTLTLDRCTVSGNSAGSLGGGIYSSSSGTLAVTNSTLTGNTAVQYGGAIYHTCPLTLVHATISGNHANGKGGGVYNDYESPLTLRSSIVAGNTAPLSANFFGPFTGSPQNLTAGDPGLAPLGNYGGPTQTMPPRPGSPAIDKAVDEGLAIDQRGFPRVLSNAADIGAAESPDGGYNPDGLSIYTRVPAADAVGVFEFSQDPEFLPFISTIAGSGTPGLLDDARLDAKFGYPSAVARDEDGNLFVADAGNHRIRMIAPGGEVVTIAGSGEFSGLADGPGTDAAFSFPSGIAVGPDGNVYVADTYNHRICKLTRPAEAGGIWMVETLAGAKTVGTAGYVNQPKSAARFNYPYGLAVDGAGNVFVADSLNHCIRKITPDGGVSTFAGTGVAGLPGGATPKFNTPKGLALADDGSTLVVADSGNHCIRKIAIVAGLADSVTVFAGSDAGVFGNINAVGTAARFNTPTAIATDGHGKFYAADEQNHGIRMIIADGTVSRVAGIGTAGFLNGNSDVASFRAPTGVLVGGDGNLIVADRDNHVIRGIVIENTKQTAASIAGDINGAGLQQVSATLDPTALNLQPGATYFFRWVSTVSGATQNPGASFTVYEMPEIATDPADPVTPTAARLNATVNARNSPTKVVFEYSTDPEMLPPVGVSTLADATGNGVVPDGTGGVYLADGAGHRVLHVSAAGVVTTFAGSGMAGFADGPGATAKFESPAGLARDAVGNVYVADAGNHRIRKITPAGVVSTFSGSGVAGFADGAADAAMFLYPGGLALDAAGNLHVADTGNHRIRIVSPSGVAATFAGAGDEGSADGAAASARFSSPRSVAVSADGSRVLVADTGNHRIRLIFNGEVFTLAGSGTAGFADGDGAAASFSAPSGIAMDDDGAGYVADSGNNRIRRVDGDGVVTTLAGSGIAGTVDSPDAALALYPAIATQFDQPSGIALDAAGNLFVSQAGVVREISRAAEMPSVTVTPDATGGSDNAVQADVPQALLPNFTYYFRAKATNYRGTVTGETLDFLTPQAAISVFAGADTGSPALVSGQDEAFDFGTTPTGQAITKTFTIANPGSYLLHVAAVSPPAGYQATGGVAIIDPLGFGTFSLTLSANAAGTYAGTVTINSDAPGQATFDFPITGLVLDPPAVTTLAATGTSSAPILNAAVNPRGSATTVWFEYSVDPEFDGRIVSTIASLAPGMPSGIATDAAGNVYVADTLGHRIRKISPAGVISDFAGTGVAGFKDGADAQFNEPVGLAMGAGGVLYVADSKNHRIRAISPAGVVSTFAGLGTPGFTDGVPAAARFFSPTGIAFDGTDLYVADRDNQRIRKIGPDGTVSTLAGTGVAGNANGVAGIARFTLPIGIAADSPGNVYVTEFASQAIRKIAPDGTTSVFAGSQTIPGFLDATGAAARFSSPAGLAMGTDGVLYVADRGNNRIRSIQPDGAVSTAAGRGLAGTANGRGEMASFDAPVSVTATAGGDLFAGELTHGMVRKVASAQHRVQAATGLTGDLSLPVETELAGLSGSAVIYFRAIATNVGGTTVGGTLSSGRSFAAWQIEHFGTDATNPAIAGPDANPTHDGVPNLVKYALQLDPAVAVSAGLPVLSSSGGNVTLTFHRVLGAVDLDCHAEWSTDLQAWSRTGISEEIPNDDGSVETVLASLPTPPGGTLFLRLHVTLSQP